MTHDLTEIERARRDFRIRSNIEAILCIEAERIAARAVALVKGPRLGRGPDHEMKMNGGSSLVHRREPLK